MTSLFTRRCPGGPRWVNPYLAAKAIGTAAVLASGRVELGSGVGWCREGFALIGERFDVRGTGTDGRIELTRALTRALWRERSAEKVCRRCCPLHDM